MTLSMPELAFAALAGGTIGFLTGMFGAGGAFLLVPVLNIALGIEMDLAVGSVACYILGPATTSLLARRIRLHHTRLPLTIAGGLLAGVLAGAWLLESIQQEGTLSVAGTAVPAADLVVLLCYLGLLSSLGVFLIWEAHRGTQVPRGRLAGVRLPPRARFPEFGGRPLSIPVLAWFGLAVGFLSGLLGMGGGLILLPAMVYLLGMRTQQAVIGSMLIVWLVSLMSTLTHAWHENIDLMLVAVLLLGGTIGARLGTDAGTRLAGRQLRQYFGWLVLAAAVLVLLRLIGLI
ncbi:MAG: sulfite exporter TauE/SafE family protein [Planctomycetaceae bacterium]